MSFISRKLITNTYIDNGFIEQLCGGKIVDGEYRADWPRDASWVWAFIQWLLT